MKKNAYPGACNVCGEPVAAYAGALLGPPWRVHCIPCSGHVPNAKVVTRVYRHTSGEIAFKPDGKLDERFNAFVEALRGAGGRYDGFVNRAKLDKALDCIAALEKAQFTLEVHPEVSASLQAFAQAHKSNVVAAGERADRIDAQLRERGLALYPFQKIGVEWLAPRYRALLADDRGLGKTIEVLAALPENAAVLVIGPQVSMGVWADETRKWRPDITPKRVGPKDFHWPAPGEMVLCTYGHQPDVLLDPENVHEGTVVVADECQAIKDPKTKRTRRFRDILHRVLAKSGRAWLLTGSPLLNDPRELWSILQAASLGKEAFGSWDNFCRVFQATMDPYGKFRFGAALPEVAEMLRKVMLRREKAEVLSELPEKTYETLFVDIGHTWDAELAKCEDQLRLHIPSVYDWIRAGADAWREDTPKPGQTRPDPAVESKEVEEARRTLLGTEWVSFPGTSRMRTLLAKAKIPALLNFLDEFEEYGEPLLVFSDHRAPIDILATRPGWAVITGDVEGEDRQRIARDFQDGKYQGLGITYGAGGTALTLTRAAHIVRVDRVYTPELNDQAVDRAARIGQTRGVIVTDLVANHYLDRRLEEILDHKTRVIQSSVGAASLKADERPPVQQDNLAVVDFAKLAADAEQSRQEHAAAKAEAQRIAAERAANSAELRAKMAAELEAKKIKEKGEARYRAARERAIGRGWVVDANHPDRRSPQGPIEEWAANALSTLSGLDPDRARDRNDVGFSKSDSYLGHWLTVEIGVGGLTPNQWQLAINLCRTYHRQVGRCPNEEEKAS